MEHKNLKFSLGIKIKTDDKRAFPFSLILTSKFLCKKCTI